MWGGIRRNLTDIQIEIESDQDVEDAESEEPNANADPFQTILPSIDSKGSGGGSCSLMTVNPVTFTFPIFMILTALPIIIIRRRSV